MRLSVDTNGSDFAVFMPTNDEHSTENWRIFLLANPESIIGEFFDTNRVRLRRMVEFRLDPRLSRRIDPDDVLQEAYLAAIQRAKHLANHGPDRVFVWLRWTVEQTLVDLHRKHLGAQMRDVFREQSIDQAALSQSTSISLVARLAADITSASNVAIKHEQATRLRHAITQMDEIDREVLVLRHFEELSNQEVAEILDIQETTASNRYVRALRRLKEILDSLSSSS